jgi:L-amino acid N-acyltransferase YncA
MQPRIRMADPDRDAAAVSEIYRAFVERSIATFEVEPPSEKAMAERMRAILRRTPWLAAVSDDVVIGYCYAGPHRERHGYRWSVNISAYVREGYRGRGIGRALYGRLLPILRRQGYANAYAGIALPNPASMALHEGIGMERVGVYRRVGWKHGAWHDVAWYGMRLGEPPSKPSGEPSEPVPLTELGAIPELEVTTR